MITFLIEGVADKSANYLVSQKWDHNFGEQGCVDTCWDRGEFTNLEGKCEFAISTSDGQMCECNFRRSLDGKRTFWSILLVKGTFEPLDGEHLWMFKGTITPFMVKGVSFGC